MPWNVGETIERPYRHACKDAAADPALFNVFRRLRPIREVIDNISFKPGYRQQIECAIERVCPISSGHLRRLEDIDTIGSPSHPISSHKRRPYQNLSPSMLRYVLRTAELLSCFGTLDGMRIAEIGGGYGGLAAVIHTFCKPTSYAIYDLPEPCNLATKYLDKLKIDVTCYGNCDCPTEDYDLCISDFGIAELGSNLRNKYAANVLTHSARGAIAWSLAPMEDVDDQLCYFCDVAEVFICVDEWLRRVLLRRKNVCSVKEWLTQFKISTVRIGRGSDLPFFRSINGASDIDWGQNHFYWKPT